MPLRTGETFAGYRILRLLGSGGMGEVYLVQHPRLPRQDALKVLGPDVSADASFRDRFIREADLAAGLWHPHIVGVHDRGENEGQLWIAMDYVDGQDAAQLMQRRYPAGMPAEEVALIVTAIASALDYAHKRGLIHRDVKPANIMLAQPDEPDEDERRILLTDFGIARPIDDTSGLTTTNMTVGTVAYAAPEQLMGEEVDGRADQYALAATTHYLLAGRPLYAYTNPAVVISKHLTGEPPALADAHPELAAVDAVLSAGLAKRRDDRFRCCADFARALKEQVSTGGSASAVAPTTPAPVPRRRTTHQGASTKPATPALGGVSRSRRWPVIVGVGAVVFLGAVLAILWPRQPHDESPPSANSATLPTNPLPSSTASTSTTSPPPPVVPATAIDSLLLGIGAVNDTLGSGTLEVKDSSFGTSDNMAHVTPAACVGVVYGAEQLVYRDTGFLQMRNQNLYPRPYTESDVIDSGQPWMGQQTVVVFPTEVQAHSVLTSSDDRWRSCASEPVMDKGYEFTAPWELRGVQLRGDVLTVSLVDPSVGGPNAGACQHAMGVRLNVLAEAVTCTAHTSAAGNGAERIVLAILDKVHA
jgi:serine/threonine-protein kinase